MSLDGRGFADFLDGLDSVSGKTLGRFAILELIKTGGMGLVYRARDVLLGRVVAAKFLPTWAAHHGPSRARLRQEASLAASLSHPNIVPVFDLVEAEGVEFIVMERIAGAPLHRIVPTGGLVLPKVLRFAVRLADALAFAHSRGVIHRDLKLSNVMIGSDGRVTLIDFGLAARLGEPTEQGPGSPMWLAPEEQAGRSVLPDPRSEIFSFGILLHQMAGGRHPFGPGAPSAVAQAICQRSPLPLPEYTSKRLGSIVERCLAKDPAQRYDSMTAVLDDLKACRKACGVT